MRVIHGAKDIIETLEDALASARKGEFLTVVVAATRKVEDRVTVLNTWAAVEDFPAFVYMVAGLRAAEHDIFRQTEE